MFDHNELFYEKLEMNGWGHNEPTGYQYMDIDEEEDEEDEEEYEGETVAEYLARNWDWTKVIEW